MTPPREHRPVHEAVKKRSADSKRRPTTREKKIKRMQQIVTWGLILVFGITSVGFIYSYSQTDQPDQQQQASQETLRSRLQEEERLGRENPTDATWPFSQARTYFEMADVDNAVKALRETLKRDPAHLPALQMLSRVTLEKGQVKETVEILESGIAAENKDVERRNKERPKEDPEIYPDARLRALLFVAYTSLGPQHEAKARTVAREGLELNPNEFTSTLAQPVIEMAMGEKKQFAMQALEIARQEAVKLKVPSAAGQIMEISRLVAQFNQPRPSPGRSAAPGAPVASPTASPAAVPSPATTP